MGRQFQVAIPGQRGHEAGEQPPHVLGVDQLVGTLTATAL